jgi:hypothetical protein
VRHLDSGVESFAQIKSIFFSFNFVGKPDVPSVMDSTTFANSAVYKRRPCAPVTRTLTPVARFSPASSEDGKIRSTATSSNALDDSCSNTMLDVSSEPQGFLSCSCLRASGSTSSVLSLHGTRCEQAESVTGGR